MQNNRLGYWAAKSPSWDLTNVDVGISTIFGEEKYHLRPLLVFPTAAVIHMVFSVFFGSVLLLRLFKCFFHVEEEICNLLMSSLGLGFHPFEMQT